MTSDILLAIGGVGLFLLGVAELTEGLRAVAGETLRRALTRFTTSPLSGAATGAATTAIIQSSSATTVTAVGFVGAGLLTFPQALGVIFGANVGTTVTGWLVAILGFRLQLGLVAPPLVLIGALLRIFAQGRARDAGTALVGFSLLFIGIDAMKAGMDAFGGVVTPADFPPDTLLGRLELVLAGVLITVVTQSSSAGVATALAALGAGAISFPQAAALVIGMDVGTTFTAALATLGGSAAMRRTGYAHVVYNLMTGAAAFFLLTPYAALAGGLGMTGSATDAQVALVAFHTGFNLLGVALVLPFAAPFARLIERLVPETGPMALRRLDLRLLRDPAAAADAVSATVREIAGEVLRGLSRQLTPDGAGLIDARGMRALSDAIAETRAYAGRIRTAPGPSRAHLRHVAAMHALDHLERLQRRRLQYTRARSAQGDARLRRLSAILRGAIDKALADDGFPGETALIDRVRRLMRAQQWSFRARTIEAASRLEIDADEAMRRLDAVRWLHRNAFHVWRTLHHLEVALGEPGPAPPAVEEEG